MWAPEWVVVIPVKRLAEAKTRLRPATTGVPGVVHEDLVLALASDTVRAALACPLVGEAIAITDDPQAARMLAGLGARVVPDQPAAGLNPALSRTASQLVRHPVAALTADLPALRAEELAGALDAVSGRTAGFVADAAGTGTTLLAAPAGVRFDPQFGPASAARHAAGGARRLLGHWPGLRRDVDTPADLAEAQRLGLGPATTALWPPTAPQAARPTPA